VTGGRIDVPLIGV